MSCATAQNASGPRSGDKTLKKPTSSVLRGAIQLGIGYTVGNLTSKPDRDVLMQDFYMVESVFMPSEGSNLTPAHHYPDFRFKTYAPVAFRYFRELFGIKPDDYLYSICNEPLIELSNPGASSSWFYVTSDDEFIIKTVQPKEAEFLQKLLPGYYMNLNQNPRTLLPKFYGLYCVQSSGVNTRVVVMNNVLPRAMKMHYKYDLKGSTYKRRASRKEREKSSPTYKDLDFQAMHAEGLHFDHDTYCALTKTLQRDCRVLESFKIMDYSLLLGIHVLDQRVKVGEAEQRGAREVAGARGRRMSQKVLYSTALESIQGDGKASEAMTTDDTMGGIPAKHKDQKLLLFLGIIDILQSYRFIKKLEHSWKALVHDGDSVSVHRPGFYADRFLKFMSSTVFKKIPGIRGASSKRKRSSIMAQRSASQELLSPPREEREERRERRERARSLASLSGHGPHPHADQATLPVGLNPGISMATTTSFSSLTVNQNPESLRSKSSGDLSCSTLTLQDSCSSLGSAPSRLDGDRDNRPALEVCIVSTGDVITDSAPLSSCDINTAPLSSCDIDTDSTPLGSCDIDTDSTPLSSCDINTDSSPLSPCDINTDSTPMSSCDIITDSIPIVEFL